MVHLLTKRRNIMFWTFILIAALGLVFVKLGAYSVWVTILTSGLKLALFVIACIGIALLWRKVFGSKNN